MAILPINHDSNNDTFGATLKCHGVNSEIYCVVFTRDDVILAAYPDDSIRMGFEIWANIIPILSAVKEERKNS